MTPDHDLSVEMALESLEEYVGEIADTREWRKRFAAHHNAVLEAAAKAIKEHEWIEPQGHRISMKHSDILQQAILSMQVKA